MKRLTVLLISVWAALFATAQCQSSAHNIYYNPKDHIYQYVVTMGSRKAYLWIPPQCKRVRGVIVSPANLLERRWLEDPLIRRTAAQIGLGIIWIGPGKHDEHSFTADMKPGMARIFQKMLDDLATESGYDELTNAPVIPMGHSANGHFAWTFANAFPNRTIAVIPIKTIPFPDSLKFKDIPFCYVVGQTTEWPQFRVPDPATKPGDRDFYWPVVRDGALALRGRSTDNLVSVVTDPGGGHFDWSAHLARFIALYIRKACEYRLPLSGKGKLRPIKKETGWLTGTGGMDEDKYPAAPYWAFKGGPANGYWFFDKETAEAALKFEGDRLHRKKQMLSFIQDGKLLPVAKIGYASLKFEPESDGVSFALHTGFISTVPPELIGRGDTLRHSDRPVSLSVISGPAIQTGPDTFRIQFDRGSQGGSIYIQESIPADKIYRHAVQPGMLSIPAKLTEGSAQTIIFNVSDSLIDRHTKIIKLNARSTANLPVRYYVEAGPAYIGSDSQLHISQIPVKTTFPVKITVIAYQWGRIVAPLYQSAEPIVKNYYIIRHHSIQKHDQRNRNF